MIHKYRKIIITKQGKNVTKTEPTTMYQFLSPLYKTNTTFHTTTTIHVHLCILTLKILYFIFEK